ncbi:MAG TPA: hypothetical protein PLB27_00740, partial [Bacteroidales bacterium]|nr:hypothetical protein [Bacteroidales bacterium]
MKGYYKISVFLLFCLIIIAGCKRNHYKVNTSSIDADITIKRLEKSLFEPDPAKLQANLPLLREEYGSFLQLFSYVINAGDINNTIFPGILMNFVTDKVNYGVYEKVIQLYPSMDPYEKELEEAFRHYIYYFPERHVPSVVTCITGFNNSIITGDSVLGIGLDRYLGRDSE